MPKFFMPLAHSVSQGEEAYEGFVNTSAAYPLANATSRVFRISFPYRKQICVAEVGKEITNWHAHAGTVLAIIETTQLIFVHTHAKGGQSVPPVLVSPDEVLERTYFDDFPAPASPLPKGQAR